MANNPNEELNTNAILEAEKSLERSEHKFGPEHPDVAISLIKLALLYLKQGLPATDAPIELDKIHKNQTDPLFNRASGINKKIFLEESLFPGGEEHFKHILEIIIKAFGYDNPVFVSYLNQFGEWYRIQGRYADAEAIINQALEIGSSFPDHVATVGATHNLGRLLKDKGCYEDAEPLLKRASDMMEKALGSDHPHLAVYLNDLAALHLIQGRFADAEPLLNRSLENLENALGSDHPNVATMLNNIGTMYVDIGRYAEAEPLYKRALEIKEKVLEPDHPSIALPLNNLGLRYMDKGFYEESETLLKRALAITEKANGPDHPSTGVSINNLGNLYQKKGCYGYAKPLYERALEISEKALGSNHPDVANNLFSLANLYEEQGRYIDAEPIYKRALGIKEKSLGFDHPDVSDNLDGLAKLFYDQGRYVEARPLFERAIIITENALGFEHPNIASSLCGLALLHQSQGHYDDALPLFKRALAITEKARGGDNPENLAILNNLALLHQEQDNYTDALSFYKRAIEVQGKTREADHPDVATMLNNIASLSDQFGKFAEAEKYFLRALAIIEKALGADNPKAAMLLHNLAGTYENQDRHAEALGCARRASAIYRDRAGHANDIRSSGILSEQKKVSDVFMQCAYLALVMADHVVTRRVEFVAEGFEAAQLARATKTEAAIAQMGDRFAVGEGELARAVRARQDAAEQWRLADKALLDALSRSSGARDPSMESNLRTTLRNSEKILSAQDEILINQFPDYAELSKPQPVPLGDVQNLLDEDEALIFYNVLPDRVFLWVVRQKSFDAHRFNISLDELGKAVNRLRGSLDTSGIEREEDVQSYDCAVAYNLYCDIFEPAEPMFEGLRHLFVVSDGPLESLPLGVLVTEKPQGEIQDLSDYRQVSWLAQKYTLSILPAVSSLKILRMFAKKAGGKVPFTGFGDPVLKGPPGGKRGGNFLDGLYRGAIANVEAVRQLPPLPNTATELREIAKILRAGNKKIYLRGRATERMVKSLNLSNIKVLVFATHALVAGEFKGIAEPALVFTPPDVGTEEDDGLLTAGDIATLKLNADLVVLSACNTAASDGTPGAEGLSGLAKAFFYAGTRTLLVSHWATETSAAMKLTTQMFMEAENQSVGWSEALWLSMKTLMDNPKYAHPMFWAPFVIVGDGGSHTNFEGVLPKKTAGII